MTSSTAPELLWQPAPDQGRRIRIEGFREWLRTERGVDLPDYRALWR